MLWNQTVTERTSLQGMGRPRSAHSSSKTDAAIRKSLALYAYDVGRTRHDVQVGEGEQEREVVCLPAVSVSWMRDLSDMVIADKDRLSWRGKGKALTMLVSSYGEGGR